MLEFSEVESQRFKKTIYRAKAEKIDNPLRKNILACRPDLLILRVPTSELPRLQSLQLMGVTPQVCDTLVYYDIDLTAITPAEPKNKSLLFKRAQRDDAATMTKLVGSIFSSYENHYASNPYLDSGDIQSAFMHWASTFVAEDPSLMGWLVYINNEPVAFCNCAVRDDGFEGVLYGVHPNHAGQGIYGDLISFTQKFAKTVGHNRMYVSTQIQNTVVQKSWLRHGFKMEKSLNTIHFNLFMSDDWVIKKHVTQLKLDDRTISLMAEATHDHNPLHFDDSVAKQMGFDRRIAHGVTAVGEISKILGTALPGSGTLYLSQNANFLMPMYPGETYEFEVALKHYTRKNGNMVLRTTARNHKNQLAFYGLATVRNKDFAMKLLHDNSPTIL